jgi:Family of unknown function (DUF6526)
MVFMSTLKTQSFRSHASFDPAFHVAAAVALLFNLVLSVVILISNLHSQLLLSLWIVVLSLTMLILYLKIRTYPLKVQDRVIRLEERLRLTALLPQPLQRRIPELNEDQLIGLRFASDSELPSLVELALDKQLNRKQIKERIQTWRPDYWRI